MQIAYKITIFQINILRLHKIMHKKNTLCPNRLAVSNTGGPVRVTDHCAPRYNPSPKEIAENEITCPLTLPGPRQDFGQLWS